MRHARRETFISAAQVARYYGGYTLDDALKLSKSTRELLLGVVLSEEERFFQRFENSLGVTWDTKDLVEMHVKGGSLDVGDKLQPRIRIPLLAALAPEMLKSLSEDFRKRLYKAKEYAENVPKGNTVVDVANLSAEQAKAFFKQLYGSPGPAPGSEG